MAIVFASCAQDALAAVVILISIGVWYVRHQFSHWQRRGIPHLPPSFPFGNFADNFLQRNSFADVTRLHYNATSEPVLGVWTALQPTLYINDPDLIREVCIKNFAKFVDRGMYCEPAREPLSGHLFSLRGDHWRNLRAKFAPTFSSGKLKAMFGTLVDCGGPLRRFLAQTVDGADHGANQVIEMRELLAQFMTNVIASAAFGLEVDCIADPETPFRRYGRKVFAPTVWNGMRNMLANLFPRLFRLLRLRLFDADVEEFFVSAVRQNLEHREQNSVVRKDLFQLLVQLRNGGVRADGEWQTSVAAKQLLSVEECAAQAFGFYFAGFETSSTTVSFALHELAKNPKCQRRVQAEIDAVLARHGGEVTYDAVSEMKYLDWCFDETLRKYPPVPFLNRTATEDWHIPNTTMTIETGSILLIPVYALQMDPKYYPEPERFLPERFDPDHEAFNAQRPYLPFGDGPRICIGARFGKMQSKVALVCMLQDFSYELAGHSKLPMVMNPFNVLLAPIGGVNLRVTRRMK